jgi:TPR repeat protein
MNTRISKILIILTLLTISCKNKKEEATPMWNASNSDIAKWKEEALTKGDTIAYYNLSKDYMDSSYEEFLETALTMANKYEYHLAFSDAYDCLTNVDRKYGEHELKPLNEETQKLAIDILKRGSQKGNPECQRKLGELYIEGVYLEKDVEKGNKLIKESEKTSS